MDGEADLSGAAVRGHVAGNELSLYVDGADLRDRLLALIADARVSLRLFYYIFAPDNAGTRVRDALIAASRRGVRVTVMIDAFGSSHTPDAFWTPLREAGGRFACFGSAWSTRYLIRNHQKMAVADRQRALIGGFNVEDAYFTPPAQGGWFDLGLMIEGDRAAHLARWFDQLWRWNDGRGNGLRALRRRVRRWRAPGGVAALLMGGPTYRLSGWARRLRGDLERAGRLDMVAAYFSPGRGMLARLGRIARRSAAAGEPSRIILPSRSDNVMTVSASRLLYGPLVRRGMRIYEYQPGKLHMKLILMDDVVYIGSANFDMRSLFLNLELMLRVEDAAFAAGVRARFVEWLDECRPITPAVLRTRKRPLRLIKGWISYFLVAVVDYTVTRRLNFREDRYSDLP